LNFWPKSFANSTWLSEGPKGETYYLSDKIGLDLAILERDSHVMRTLLAIKDL